MTTSTTTDRRIDPRLPRYLAACAATVVVWVAAYWNLQPFAAWLTYRVIGLEAGSQVASAV